MPFGADNALIKAAEIVRRLSAYRPAAHIDDIWRAQVAAMDLSDEIRDGLTSTETIFATLEKMPVAVARMCHAETHTTISPNVVHGGQKTNTIPDVVDIDVDVRTVPGTTRNDVEALLREALGDLYEQVDITVLQHSDPTASTFGSANALWEAVTKHTQVAYPGAEIVPGLIVGGTDARFYRERGITAYGSGLFSPQIDAAAFGSRFHGNDERIDVDSLGLSANFFYGVAKDLTS